jgi:hypothetical protein
MILQRIVLSVASSSVLSFALSGCQQVSSVPQPLVSTPQYVAPLLHVPQPSSSGVVITPYDVQPIQRTSL